jgi:anti-sigma regulatory factor (Ser/Thr protein kinase)
VETDRQSELEWRRARENRAQSNLLREHAASTRERTQLLTNRLVHTLRTHDGHALGAHGNAFSLRVARLPQSIALVRHELRRWLDDSGVVPDDALDITLACSEACANAVEHPGRPGHLAFEIEARRDDRELLITVRDFGAWTQTEASSTRGRGLAMIRELMDGVEITSSGGGTQIVMHRTLKPVS